MRAIAGLATSEDQRHEPRLFRQGEHFHVAHQRGDIPVALVDQPIRHFHPESILGEVGLLPAQILQAFVRPLDQVACVEPCRFAGGASARPVLLLQIAIEAEGDLYP